VTTTSGEPTLRAVSAGRPPIVKHPWRVAIVVVVLVLVANLGVFLLSQSDTSRGGRTLPEGIDTIDPAPGELVGPETTITADLRGDLTGVLVIDGAEVPDDQLDRVVNLGVVSFRPGSDKDLDRFTEGGHSAVIEYWSQTKERPRNPASYSWSFRVGA
jgi:hypothetical protein